MPWKSMTNARVLNVRGRLKSGKPSDASITNGLLTITGPDGARITVRLRKPRRGIESSYPVDYRSMFPIPSVNINCNAGRNQIFTCEGQIDFEVKQIRLDADLENQEAHSDFWVEVTFSLPPRMHSV